VREELILWFGKKMIESLFSIMHKVLGDGSEDAERWDIAFFYQSCLSKGYLTNPFANSAYSQ
jgi:hypothetical protein